MPLHHDRGADRHDVDRPDHAGAAAAGRPVHRAAPAEQALWFGVITFAFGVANFFGAPLLGALSDRYGRRPVLLLGFCRPGAELHRHRAGHRAVDADRWCAWSAAAMQANAAVANAYVADITPPEERARRFGLLGAMFGIGFILGPVMGGLLGGIDLHLPFFVAGALALVNWSVRLLRAARIAAARAAPAAAPGARPIRWRRCRRLAALTGRRAGWSW